MGKKSNSFLVTNLDALYINLSVPGFRRKTRITEKLRMGFRKAHSDPRGKSNDDVDDEWHSKACTWSRHPKHDSASHLTRSAQQYGNYNTANFLMTS